MTSPNWRFEASALRLHAMIWEAAADSAVTGFAHLGSVGLDFGQNVALRLRECAREAVHAAREIDRYAEEEPCQQDDDTPDVGRTDEWPQSLTIVQGGAA